MKAFIKQALLDYLYSCRAFCANDVCLYGPCESTCVATGTAQCQQVHEWIPGIMEQRHEGEGK